MVKILGSNDEQTTCDCCGKRNLKKTVVLEFDNGEIKRYGVDCAARTIHGNNKKSSTQAIERMAKAVKVANKYIGQYGAIRTAQIVHKTTGYSFSTKNGKILDFSSNVIASE